MGDTNARLGHILNDRNLRGKLTINANQPLFLGFLQYSGLIILNSKFCKGVPTYEIINKKRSIIDLGLTNSPNTVMNFKVEPTPFGVNCQTCHRALTTTLKLSPPEKHVPTAPRRNVTRVRTDREMEYLGASVSRQILESGSSADYRTLLEMFYQVKGTITKKHRKNPGHKIHKSPLMQNLGRRFSKAVKILQRDKSQFALFVVGNLEKLINSQYEKEEEEKMSKWLKEMNDLDFLNRTRTFFIKLRKKHKVRENFVPIIDKAGAISKNIDQTLINWAEYYEKLYFCRDEVVRFPTPDYDEFLDKELELAEFLDEFYSLKRHKSPGYDGLTSEDFLSLIPKDSPEDEPNAEAKLNALKNIFVILESFWFNETVPRDFKRTILRPFLKNEGKDHSNPDNYRPISLLNTLMKIYEGIIAKRITQFFEKNNVLSPFQVAYRQNRSAFDNILILHEIFLEYRFYKVGPRGGLSKKPLYLVFLDFKKAFDTVIRNLLFKKLCAAGIRGKILRVIQNLFSKNPANVVVDGFLSPEFVINRGVLQGSKLGPILFNLFINDLLEELNRSNLGAYIGPLHFAALGFADDIVLISDTPDKLQQLLEICSSWTQKNQMAFKTSKCKVMILNGTCSNARFTLDNVALEIVSEYKYLGTVMNSKYVTNLFKGHFDLIHKKAKTRPLSEHTDSAKMVSS